MEHILKWMCKSNRTCPNCRNHFDFTSTDDKSPVLFSHPPVDDASDDGDESRGYDSRGDDDDRDDDRDDDDRDDFFHRPVCK
jgi:hypothetical protein